MHDIAIYRRILLPASESFILNQAEALRQFRPWYVGMRIERAARLPEERSFAASRGGLIGRTWTHLFGSTYLQKVLDTIQPALVHAHFGPDGVEALSFARALGVPLVTTFHGYDATVTREHALHASSSQHRRFARQMEVLQESGALFIAVSQFIRCKLLEKGFPDDKIRVHYIGVDTRGLGCDPQVDRLPTVLFVGRLVANKGCSYLVRAMSLVQRSLPDTELVIIGDGPQRRALESLAKTQIHRVRFLGTQPPHLVREWMQRSRILCVPSVTVDSGASEGFGLVFAEAQALGLPVVSFRTGGIPEAVAHGETGLLAEERDIKALSEYIAMLFEDRDLWERFSSAGQARIRRLFDLQQQTRILEKVYRLVLAHHGTVHSNSGSRDLYLNSAQAC